MTFTSIDHDKFRALRVTHVATRFEELIGDEANDTLTPEQLFVTSVDDALEQRLAHKIERLIRQAQVADLGLRTALWWWGPEPRVHCNARAGAISGFMTFVVERVTRSWWRPQPGLRAPRPEDRASRQQ